MDGPTREDMQQAAAQALQTIQTQTGMRMTEAAFDACFERCVPTVPSGGKLDHGKQMCMSACTAAYFSVFQVASETVREAVSASSASAGGTGSGW